MSVSNSQKTQVNLIIVQIKCQGREKTPGNACSLRLSGMSPGVHACVRAFVCVCLPFLLLLSSSFPPFPSTPPSSSFSSFKTGSDYSDWLVKQFFCFSLLSVEATEWLLLLSDLVLGYFPGIRIESDRVTPLIHCCQDEGADSLISVITSK